MAEGKGQTERQLPGDWTCPSCSTNVFASKSSCFKCGASKEGGGGATQAQGGKGGGSRPGDWNCPKCGHNVFASKNQCFKCGSNKEGEGGKGGGKAQQLNVQWPGEQGQSGQQLEPSAPPCKPAKPGSTPFFEYSPGFAGARPGYVFKLDHMGLGYYLDSLQTLLPKIREQLPALWREAPMREERLKVDVKTGAGVALEPSEFGFLVTKVADEPGQNLTQGDVVVAVEGRLFVGISGDQMKASFLKRRVDGARLAVVRLEEVKELAAQDASIIEGWDARNGCKYFFSKRSGLSAWSIEDLKKKEAPKAVEEKAPEAPVDLSHFLQHGFMKALESEQEKTNKKRKKKESAEPEKDVSDLARDEKSRWNDWNEGGTGGYTEAFFDRYKNAKAFPGEKKAVKVMKGSVGPGLGLDRFEKWTGSKNSFN